jgi:hypothetical protein
MLKNNINITRFPAIDYAFKNHVLDSLGDILRLFPIISSIISLSAISSCINSRYIK